jgi:hypothetical protein
MDKTELAMCPPASKMSVSVFGSIVRAGLSTAPFTGGVATLWSEWSTHRRFVRVEDAIRKLGEELVNCETFDPTKLGEPEMQLLEDVLERIAKEHREVKQARFAKLLASNWVNTHRSFEERLLFQRAFDEFDDVHLRLLQILNAEHKTGVITVPAGALCKSIFGEAADEETNYGVFVPALNKLAAEYGFVRRRAQSSGLMTNINPDGLVFHTDCLLLPIGRRFIESIGS